MDRGRRQLLMIGGALGLGVAWQAFIARPAPLEFRPIARAPGYRFAQIGGVTRLSGTDLLTVGLEERPDRLEPDALNAALHQGGTGRPVAVFSDFFCPYCRGLVSRMARYDGPELALTWHELPLLGPNSVLAARAAEAASIQGGYMPFYEGLVARGFRPSRRHLGEVAQAVGLDRSQFLFDMDSNTVQTRLDLSARVASTLGIVGTPGIAIGQSVVLGALSDDQMQELIAQTPPRQS